MPNVINANGLTTKTQEELIAEYTAAMQSIYGSDINLDSDTPDGQKMMIDIQAQLDQYDMLRQVFNSMDPDQATGVVLDQRVSFNGIKRKEGTYSVTDITVTVDRSLNLYGLEQTANEVFTVSDNAGTEWQLTITQNIVTPGSHIFQFRARNIGEVLSIPNTIQTQSTIVVGVTGVNNPTQQSLIGTNEESDLALKERRRKAVGLVSQGYLQAMKAALENINGVVEARIYENKTGSTDIDGIPSHSIWVVVDGSPDAEDVAMAIYTKRNAGAGMKGDEVFTITQVDGTPFDVRWDFAESEQLFIQIQTQPINPGTSVNFDLIRTELPNMFDFGLYKQITINDLISNINQLDPNCLVDSGGYSISLSGPFINAISPSSKDQKFSLVSANVILYPMQLTPDGILVSPLAVVQMVTKGGYGTYSYAITVNNSGGSIDPVTGVYTAGASIGIDTIQVTDSKSNTSTATIEVV